jgi:hypothetical protein
MRDFVASLPEMDFTAWLSFWDNRAFHRHFSVELWRERAFVSCLTVTRSVASILRLLFLPSVPM